MNSLTYDQIPIAFARKLPELKALLDENTVEDGTVLSHLLVGDLVPVLLGTHYKIPGGVLDRSLMKRIFEFAEDLADSSDPTVRDAIIAEFLPAFDKNDRRFPEFWDFMGPRTREIYQTVLDTP